MSIMVFNATDSKEIRVALMDELKHERKTSFQLYDLEIERADEIPTKANIYGQAIITRIEPSLEAAFIDYGGERHGFLPLKDIASEYYISDAGNGSSGQGSDSLKVGQKLIVQIEKEERGSKGAALTTYISLAGSYLVLMPNSPKTGGISRRIEGHERDQLKHVLGQLKTPKGMGFIVRTAGLGKKLEELQWDLDALVNYWLSIKKKAEQESTQSSKRPYLLHQDGNVVIRAIRDNLRADVSDVVVDDESSFNLIKRYIKEINPGFDLSKITLYQNPEPVFSFYNIEREIEKAHQREVKLPSGGVIVIDRAEALVAIDINSSKATKASDIEQTALQTNVEAADEIARQLRLRDLGGLVVIDFIDMSHFQNQKTVENRLKEALSRDRARIQIGKISRFGLLEMSRQRIKAPLAKVHNVICPRCDGQGMISSIERVSQKLVRLLQQEVLNVRCQQIQLYVPLDVAAYLLNECRAAIVRMESTYSKLIVVVPNPNLQSPQYHIKIISNETPHDETTLPTTYSLIAPKNFTTPKRTESEHVTAKTGAPQRFSRSTPAAVLKSGGLFAGLKRFFSGLGHKDRSKNKTTHAGGRRHHTRGSATRSTKSASAAKGGARRHHASSQQRSRQPARRPRKET